MRIIAILTDERRGLAGTETTMTAKILEHLTIPAAEDDGEAMIRQAELVSDATRLIRILPTHVTPPLAHS
jgi:hypothetical protein